MKGCVTELIGQVHVVVKARHCPRRPSVTNSLSRGGEFAHDRARFSAFEHLPSVVEEQAAASLGDVFECGRAPRVMELDAEDVFQRSGGQKA